MLFSLIANNTCQQHKHLNACRIVFKKQFFFQFLLNLFSIVPVRKGEHLTTTYTDTLKTTLERRKHLLQTKIFECDCKRCGDSSELSTFGSSWRCQRCKNGLIASTIPLSMTTEWKCGNCNSVFSSEVKLTFSIASELSNFFIHHKNT